MNIEDRFEINHEGIIPLSGEAVPRWAYDISILMQNFRNSQARIQALEYLNKKGLEIIQQLEEVSK